MNEICVIQDIQKYSDTCLIESEMDFDEWSYSKWAVDEILERVVEEASKLPYHITGIPLISPVEILQEFVDEMDYLSELNDETEFMFSTAKNVGLDLLEMFS